MVFGATRGHKRRLAPAPRKSFSSTLLAAFAGSVAQGQLGCCGSSDDLSQGVHFEQPAGARSAPREPLAMGQALTMCPACTPFCATRCCGCCVVVPQGLQRELIRHRDVFRALGLRHQHLVVLWQTFQSFDQGESPGSAAWGAPIPNSCFRTCHELARGPSSGASAELLPWLQPLQPLGSDPK